VAAQHGHSKDCIGHAVTAALLYDLLEGSGRSQAKCGRQNAHVPVNAGDDRLRGAQLAVGLDGADEIPRQGKFARAMVESHAAICDVQGVLKRRAVRAHGHLLMSQEPKQARRTLEA
jgi:hypothetical protein